MNIQSIQESFAKTIATWQEAIKNYSDTDFIKKPDEESWSVGQVCEHLTITTTRIFVVTEKCLAGDANKSEEKTETGGAALQNNALADVRVKLPLAIQATPPQPENRQRAINDMETMLVKFNEAAEKIAKSNSPGKEKHPVLGYLTAVEWLQSIDMHYRHHLRQKARIDDFLQNQAASLS